MKKHMNENEWWLSEVQSLTICSTFPFVFQRRKKVTGFVQPAVNYTFSFHFEYTNHCDTLAGFKWWKHLAVSWKQVEVTFTCVCGRMWCNCSSAHLLRSHSCCGVSPITTVSSLSLFNAVMHLSFFSLFYWALWGYSASVMHCKWEWWLLVN